MEDFILRLLSAGEFLSSFHVESRNPFEIGGNVEIAAKKIPDLLHANPIEISESQLFLPAELACLGPKRELAEDSCFLSEQDVNRYPVGTYAVSPTGKVRQAVATGKHWLMIANGSLEESPARQFSVISKHSWMISRDCASPEEALANAAAKRAHTSAQRQRKSKIADLREEVYAMDWPSVVEAPRFPDAPKIGHLRLPPAGSYVPIVHPWWGYCGDVEPQLVITPWGTTEAPLVWFGRVAEIGHDFGPRGGLHTIQFDDVLRLRTEGRSAILEPTNSAGCKIETTHSGSDWQALHTHCFSDFHALKAWAQRNRRRLALHFFTREAEAVGRRKIAPLEEELRALCRKTTR